MQHPKGALYYLLQSVSMAGHKEYSCKLVEIIPSRLIATVLTLIKILKQSEYIISVACFRNVYSLLPGAV